MTACVSIIPLAKQLEASGKKYRSLVVGSVHIKGLIDEQATPKLGSVFSTEIQNNVRKLLAIQDDLRMAVHKDVCDADAEMRRDLLAFLKFFDKHAKMLPDGSVACVLATSASSRASLVVRDVSSFTYQGDRLDEFNVSYRFENSSVQATDPMERAVDNFYFKPGII